MLPNSVKKSEFDRIAANFIKILRAQKNYKKNISSLLAEQLFVGNDNENTPN